MISGFERFELDLTYALLGQLVKVLDGMSPAELNGQNARAVPDQQGVYQLLWCGAPVYVGKTEADSGLRHRLERHANTIRHRQNLKSQEVSFKAVHVSIFSAVDLEAQLIGHYSRGKQLSWNRSGFGSNDPGRHREDTMRKKDHFDALYPINIDVPLALSLRPTATAREAIELLRAELPYVIRFEKAKRGAKTPHQELDAAIVGPWTSRKCTARTLIEHIVSQLPSGWQATDLLSRVILYREKRRYRQGQVIARSP